MCLSPKMPAAPEPPPPAPAPVITSTTPTTVKPTMSKRASLRQASQGTSSLTIPLGGTGGGGSSMTNLSIGK
jgi:hypothetical protein